MESNCSVKTDLPFEKVAIFDDVFLFFFMSLKFIAPLRVGIGTFSLLLRVASGSMSLISRHFFINQDLLFEEELILVSQLNVVAKIR